MLIREYQSSDCKELAELFYNTVHTVNAKDYTKEQLDVWATRQAERQEIFLTNFVMIKGYKDTGRQLSEAADRKETKVREGW